jgi:hypothetical protein
MYYVKKQVRESWKIRVHIAVLLKVLPSEAVSSVMICRWSRPAPHQITPDTAY